VAQESRGGETRWPMYQKGWRSSGETAIILQTSKFNTEKKRPSTHSAGGGPDPVGKGVRERNQRREGWRENLSGGMKPQPYSVEEGSRRYDRKSPKCNISRGLLRTRQIIYRRCGQRTPNSLRTQPRLWNKRSAFSMGGQRMFTGQCSHELEDAIKPPV